MVEPKMREQLSKIYVSLSQQILQLSYGWKFHKQLYHSGSENIRILKYTAPVFFLHVQGIFLEYFILSVRRLTDQKQTGKYGNLSLEQLVENIDSTENLTLKKELKKYLDDNYGKFEFFRKTGHKLVAHNSLNELLNNSPARLPYDIPIKEFEEVLSILIIFMNKFESHFGAPILYSKIQVNGDANDLLNCLFKAEKAFEKESHNIE